MLGLIHSESPQFNTFMFEENTSNAEEAPGILYPLPTQFFTPEEIQEQFHYESQIKEMATLKNYRREMEQIENNF